ncbi:hypothetical protein BJ875DRAFT_6608 [Amylocarpus encephaloides]|uniref:Uncharacterized protein n=1 Tax=Amylocarpus encephaloides TaxID=45428 RepID=A0A9P7YIZ4_9HELO|nr:hypothetical protein BJ875DRAFT_6608 [Amylocarpus encephaloides]
MVNMLFSHRASIISLLLHSTLAQDYTSSLAFKFIAYLKTTTDLTPSIDNHALNFHDSTPLAILTPRSLSVPETIYYINGTYFDSYHSIATLWTDDSLHAINISPASARDALGRRTVYFSGTGQVGSRICILGAVRFMPVGLRGWVCSCFTGIPGRRPRQQAARTLLSLRNVLPMQRYIRMAQRRIAVPTWRFRTVLLVVLCLLQRRLELNAVYGHGQIQVDGILGSMSIRRLSGEKSYPHSTQSHMTSVYIYLIIDVKFLQYNGPLIQW